MHLIIFMLNLLIFSVIYHFDVAVARDFDYREFPIYPIYILRNQ